MNGGPLPVAIIVARTSSARLPGKVLRDVCGRPMLGLLIDRLRHCSEVGAMCLATSEDPSDDALVEFAVSNGLQYYRGSLLDVAHRVAQAAKMMKAEKFFRINGDSPLLATEFFATALQLHESESADLVTNIYPRSFPKGASVELLSAYAFMDAQKSMVEAADKEHVTRYFYMNPDGFKIRNFAIEPAVNDVSLATDDQPDFERLQRVVSQMTRPPWEYRFEEIISLYRQDKLHG